MKCHIPDPLMEKKPLLSQVVLHSLFMLDCINNEISKREQVIFIIAEEYLL